MSEWLSEQLLQQLFACDRCCQVMGIDSEQAAELAKRHIGELGVMSTTATSLLMNCVKSMAIASWQLA